MKKKRFPYVIECIKGSRKSGYRRKKGQYLTWEGRGTDNINEAHVFERYNFDNDYCADDDEYDNIGMSEYLQICPVEIKPKKK